MWTQLEPRIGFGWATRVVAFVMLVTLIVPVVVLKPLIPPSSRRTLLDFKSFLDPPFVLFGGGILFGYMGIYVVFFYIQLYATSRADANSDLAFYLLAITNAGSIFGRILPNFAADIIGTLNMMSIVAFAAAVLSMCLLAIRNVPGIVVYCILFGCFTGTFMSLPAPTTASLSAKHMSSLGARMSMAFITAAIGSLVGSPIAGAILAMDGGENWNGLLIWAGVCMIITTACMLAARTAKLGLKLVAKA
jgi:predicted MFS family arabinose efflux permease